MYVVWIMSSHISEEGHGIKTPKKRWKTNRIWRNENDQINCQVYSSNKYELKSSMKQCKQNWKRKENWKGGANIATNREKRPNKLQMWLMEKTKKKLFFVHFLGNITNSRRVSQISK